jgi:anti-anti-sigma factor
MSVYHQIAVWKDGDVHIVRFGEHRILDELAVEKIWGELSSVADRSECRKLLLNFAGVERLTTLMLGKLVMLNRQMGSKGGRLGLCEISTEILEVFATTKLSQILDTWESEPDGVKALSAEG